MNLDATVSSLKSQVLESLEAHVYEQAEKQNLADTVLRELVEAAVGRLQLQMPIATGVGGAILDVLSSLAPAVKSLGLDDRALDLIRSAGIDTAMRDRVVQGITRYLEDNGAHLMEVAVKAALGKLTRGNT